MKQERVDRNIYRRGGKYRVLVTRRGHGTLRRTCDSLEQAIHARRDLEAQVPPSRPWDHTQRRKRHTIAELRAERRAAGLCIACGDEPPERGLATCRSCLDINSAGRRERRREKRMKES